MNLIKFINQTNEEGKGVYNLLSGDHNPTEGYLAIETARNFDRLDEESVRKFVYDQINRLSNDKVYLMARKTDDVWELSTCIFSPEQGIADYLSEVNGYETVKLWN